MIKKRKIAVVSGARSEYGILKPLLEKIKNSTRLELQLIITGMHLLPQYGLTINEIKKDGFEIKKKVEMYIGSQNNPGYYGEALGRGTDGFTKIFSRERPDILVVFGDRLEHLVATLAGFILKIPTAHIHGGDKTDSGHTDELTRHAITRFAHIHFAPTHRCAQRIIRWGEEPWRVYNVGALGLDSIFSEKVIEKNELYKDFGLSPNKKTILCIFNPLPIEAKKAGRQMQEIIAAIKELKVQTLIIYPNNDAGSRDIILEIEKCRNFSFIRITPNMEHQKYISLLKYADVLVGNSSSGIIEAPSMKLPVVNIGSRNTGREHVMNIIFVKPNKNEITKAIKKALYNKKFLSRVKNCRNPYGDGKVAKKIIKILNRIKIDKRLLQKKITY